MLTYMTLVTLNHFGYQDTFVAYSGSNPELASDVKYLSTNPMTADISNVSPKETRVSISIDFKDDMEMSAKQIHIQILELDNGVLISMREQKLDSGTLEEILQESGGYIWATREFKQREAE